MKWIHVGGAVLVGLAALTYATPWAFYAFSLSRIDGRPQPPASVTLSEKDLEELRARYRLYGRADVQPITPWDYVTSLARGNEKAIAARGTNLAWAIAREYNVTHLEHHQWWHPAGAALTIWITRSWTADQIRAEALRIDRDAEVKRADIQARSKLGERPGSTQSSPDPFTARQLSPKSNDDQRTQ